MSRVLKLAFDRTIEEFRRAKPREVDADRHWRDADLSYKFWEVQKRMAEVLTSGGSLKKVLNCSRRLRKTSTALTKSIELGLKKERAKIRYNAPTQKMLRKIVHPIISLICEDAPIDRKPIWKAQDGLYLFPENGSELHIAGANNGHEDDSRGTEADLCVVDEAQMITNLKYLVNDVLMPQLITTGGWLWMLLTPPKTPVHECQEYVLEAKGNKCYAEFDIHESEYQPEVIDQFCKEAGGRESTTWKREYLCQFVVDTNFSIVPEWRDELVQEYQPDQFYRFYQRYEGLDIGVRDLTVDIFGVYDFMQAKLYLLDEVVLSGPQMTTVKLAQMVKDKEKALWGDVKPHLRISDNNNLILLQDMGQLHGLHFLPTTKDTLEAMVNNLRLWVGSGKVVISPKCVQLIGSLKYGVWDDKRKNWEHSHVYGHFDALAALMYLVRYIDVAFNPIPRDFGVNADQQFVPEKRQTNSNGDALIKALGLKKKR